MKNDTLQQLLAKYQQGTLSGEELEQLNRLTHKDEVMSAAENRAKVIVRRRSLRTVAFAMVGLSLVGVGIWAMRPAEQQQVATESVANPVPTLVESAVPMPAAVAAEEAPIVAAKHDMPREIKQHNEARQQQPAATIPQQHEEATVICNNQCDADSVLNDIWRFLTV